MYMSSCSNPCQSDITAFTIGYSAKFKSRHERSYKKNLAVSGSMRNYIK